MDDPDKVHPIVTTSSICSVVFENVRKKYSLNEDIHLEYAFVSEFIPSSRDWIGIFPRGWNNLRQYVTFEWAVGRPADILSSRRDITFYHKYHQHKVRKNKEYQFVYINKQIMMLGSSPYFCFEGDILSEYSISNEDRKASLGSEAAKQAKLKTLQSNRATQTSFQKFDRTQNDKLYDKSTDVHGLIECSIKTQNHVEWIPTCQAPTISDVEFRSKSCTDQSNPQKSEQVLHVKIKMLAEQNRELENQIKDLQQKLEMCQVAQKRLKLSSVHAKRERNVYQKFVNEILQGLSQKGLVRIIDNTGSEILLKKVSTNINEKLDSTSKAREETSNSLDHNKERKEENNSSPVNVIPEDTHKLQTKVNDIFSQSVINDLEDNEKLNTTFIIEDDAEENETFQKDKSPTKANSILGELNKVLFNRRKGIEKENVE